MNAAQLTAIREIAGAMHSATRSLTAKEMALTPHDLQCFATVAKPKDGTKFFWNQQQQLWVATTY